MDKENPPPTAAGRKTLPAAAAVIAFVLLFFFPFDTGPDRFIWNPLFDAGHFGLFLVLALAALLYHGPRLRRPYLSVAAACIVGAVVTELVQPFVGRSGSFPDLRNGVLGTCAGLCIGGALHAGRQRTLLTAMTAAAAVLVQLYLLLPAARALAGREWRAQQFPLLADFEAEAEMYLWRENSRTEIERSQAGATRGAHSLELKGDTLVGAEYFAGDRSWKELERFSFDVYSEKKRTLKIRIDDAEDCSRYHQRFNKELALQAGQNHIVIPIGEIERGPRERLLDVTRVRRVVFYTVRSEGPAVYYLDNVRLE